MLKRAAERQELVRSSTPMDALSDDCFTLLIQANEDSEEEGQKLKLTDQELVCVSVPMLCFYLTHDLRLETFTFFCLPVMVSPRHSCSRLGHCYS